MGNIGCEGHGPSSVAIFFSASAVIHRCDRLDPPDLKARGPPLLEVHRVQFLQKLLANDVGVNVHTPTHLRAVDCKEGVAGNETQR